MLSTLVNQLRPHQLVHQLAVVVVVSGFGLVSRSRIIAALGLAVLGTVGALLLSDYQHRHADAKMGRRRLVHVVGEGPMLIGIGVSLVGLVGGALWAGGIRCLGMVLGVFVATTLYTLAKRRRRLVASYLGRALAGTVLVGVYASIFTEVSFPALGRLAIAAGLLDLAGNLAGDLRDEVEDRRAGLHTLPLRVGAGWTTAAIVGLLLAAHGVVASVAQSPWLLLWSVVLGPLVTVTALAVVPRSWRHAAAHGPKLGQLLLMGAALQGTPAGPLLAACAVVGLSWWASYRSYVWSMQRVLLTGRLVASEARQHEI